MRVDTVARALGISLMVGTLAQGAMAQDAAPPAPAAMPQATTAGLSAEAIAFRDGLAQETAGLDETTRAAIDGFYASRDYRPFWNAGEGSPLAALEASVEQADAQGLPFFRYDADALQLLAGEPGMTGSPKLEVAATRTYIRFAGDLSAGIVRPLDIDPEINVKPQRATAAAVLARLPDGAVSEVLRAAEPQDPDYRALMAEKVRLEGLLGTDAWGDPVPSGPTLHLGESSPRVADLRARLARLGYGPETAQAAVDDAAPEAVETAAAASAFDPALEAEVKRFQQDNGLVDDGVAGWRTIDALNATPTDRLEQVVVNLERLRWMNHDLGARRIEVNIPDYSVVLIEHGNIPWSSRAVVGNAAETRTPEFSDEMTYMVVNPTWHIPDSIATRVYLPKLRQDPTVLARSNMRLFTRSGVEINPKLVNFNQYTAENFPFRVKQNPNSANALGRVKFMFPNQFSIYLHDTPHRELFAKDARAFSNGCIRLQEPIELAEVLLKGQVPDPQASIDGWLAAKSERYVYLDEPLPVYIMYRSAWADPDGTIRYRADIYGRDGEVFRALEAKGVSLPDAAQG